MHNKDVHIRKEKGCIIKINVIKSIKAYRYAMMVISLRTKERVRSLHFLGHIYFRMIVAKIPYYEVIYRKAKANKTNQLYVLFGKKKRKIRNFACRQKKIEFMPGNK